MSHPHFRLAPYRLLPGVDWMLLLVTFALAGCGIVTLWGAASDGQGPGPLGGFALRQCLWFALGLVFLLALAALDYRWFRHAAWILYGLLLLALVGLLVQGHVIKGARSWYSFGSRRFQPSELGKIIIILTLARRLAPRGKTFRGLRQTVAPLAIVGAPLALILAQPDLGTAAVLIPIAGAMFWIAGLRKRVIFLFCLLGFCCAAAVYPHLKPYQQGRLKTFLDPRADPRGKGYNILQAMTTLGSGQMLGKGWGRGTQTNMKFLPEYHTDFIFPTVGEQFGLVGCAAVLGLFVILIGRMIHLADATQNLFGVLTITGLAAMLCAHIALNIGMTVGLLPVTGLPLPFFSYGGSFMLTCMMAIGLALGIGARRGL